VRAEAVNAATVGARAVNAATAEANQPKAEAVKTFELLKARGGRGYKHQKNF